MSDQEKAQVAWDEICKAAKDEFKSKLSLSDEEYDSLDAIVRLGWRYVSRTYRSTTSRFRHTIMTFSGAASTIVHELKALRQLKDIAERLDSIKTIMTVMVEMEADNTGWKPREENEEDKS